MIRILQVMAIVMLLSMPQADIQGHGQDGAPHMSAYYLESLHWRQSLYFPRWEDRYAVVFEQEMLA